MSAATTSKRAGDTHAAIERAEKEYARRHDDAPAQPWMEFFDRAELSGDAGHALFDLAEAGGKPQPAFDQLGAAVTSHTDAYARSRAFCQLKVATLWMSVEPGIAVTHARRAVAAAEPLRSGRIRRYLRELHTATTPHAKHPEIAELRHNISRLAQVPA